MVHYNTVITIKLIIFLGFPIIFCEIKHSYARLGLFLLWARSPWLLPALLYARLGLLLFCARSLRLLPALLYARLGLLLLYARSPRLLPALLYARLGLLLLYARSPRLSQFVLRSNPSVRKQIETPSWCLYCLRRRRDSNPRDPEVKRISSAPRYDRFDTSACLSGTFVPDNFI